MSRLRTWHVVTASVVVTVGISLALSAVGVTNTGWHILVGVAVGGPVGWWWASLEDRR